MFNGRAAFGEVRHKKQKSSKARFGTYWGKWYGRMIKWQQGNISTMVRLRASSDVASCTGRNPKFPGQGNPMKCPGKFTFLLHFLHQEILKFPWLLLVYYRAEFQAHFLNQDMWNFRHISCSQDTWHFKHISFTFPVGTFWHKWKYLKAGQVTFHAHFLHTGNLVRRTHFLNTGKLGIIWCENLYVCRWHFLHISCICPAIS